MPAKPPQPPGPGEPDATRWDAGEAVPEQDRTRADGSPGATRWDVPAPPVPAAAPSAAADSTRWDGVAQPGAQPDARPPVPVDPGTTHWEDTSTKRVPPQVAADLGRTQWDQRSVAPSADRSTIRFADVISVSGPTAAADMTRMSLGDAPIASAPPIAPLPAPGARKYELLGLEDDPAFKQHLSAKRLALPPGWR